MHPDYDERKQPLRLRTIKKLNQEVGISVSFIKQLLYEGKLTRYKIGSATYVSLTEFEKLASNQ
jgi:hypothetical protein